LTTPGYPQGIQTLLGIAALSPEMREKVLADPLSVAAECRVELTDTERRILGQVKPDNLAHMIDRITDNVAAAGAGVSPRENGEDIRMVSLGHMPDEPETQPMPPAPTGIRPDLPRDDMLITGITPDMPRPRNDRKKPPYLKSMVDRPRSDTPVTGSRSDLPRKGCAALAALAALGAAGTCAVPSMLSSSRGSRPDIPYSKSLKPFTGIASLDRALATSRANHEPVIAVFLHAAPRGESILASQDICTFRSPAVVAAVQAGNVAVIHIDDPWVAVKTKALTDAESAKYEALETPYEKTLDGYGIGGKLPAAVVVAPDGTALKTIIRPTSEKELVKAIREAPELLEGWYNRKK